MSGPEDSLDVITLGVFAFVFLGLIYLIIMPLLRKSKGSLTLELSQVKKYHLGEDIDGRITLHTAKDLEISALQIRLSGVRYNDTDPDNVSSTDTKPFEFSTFSTIHEEAVVFKRNFKMRKGQNETYNFSFKLPTKLNTSLAAQVLNKITFEEYEWALTAVAEVPGADLYNRTVITVLYDEKIQPNRI